MKWIKYKIICNENENILIDKKVGYSEKNLTIAQKEAYNGEYTIEEDESFVDKSHGNYMGCMGYYWKSIDLTNKKIYLCSEQTTPEISTTDYTDSTFPTPDYAVGDLIAIVNNNKYYSPTAKITSIEYNVITYEGDIGFTSINVVDSSLFDSDDYSMFVKEKPETGFVSIKNGAFAVGIENKAIGNGSFSAGGGNFSYGDWSFTINTGNKAAWAAFSHGYGNEGNGFYSETGGRENINNAECGRMHGRNNTSSKKSMGADVGGKENVVDAEWVRVGGIKNNVTHGLQGSQGSDVSGESNTLNGAKNVRIHGKGNKVLGSTVSNQWGGAQSEVGGLNNTLDGRTVGATNIHMHGENNWVSHRNVDMGGKGNKSSAPNQIIRGTYNDIYNEYGDVDTNILLMLGNGTSDTQRSNAFKVDKEGNGTFAGDVIAKGKKLFTQEDLDSEMSEFENEINSRFDYFSIDTWDAIQTRAPGHIYSQTELTGEFPPLESGQLYLVYE